MALPTFEVGDNVRVKNSQLYNNREGKVVPDPASRDYSYLVDLYGSETWVMEGRKRVDKKITEQKTIRVFFLDLERV